MRRRFRIRWLLKWTGTLACLAIVLASAASLRWIVSAYQVFESGTEVTTGLLPWSFAISYDPQVTPLPEGWRFQRRSEFRYRSIASWQNKEGLWQYYGCLPQFRGQDLAHSISLRAPLWIPFVLFAIPTAVAWRLDRRRSTPGCCPNCGYNLTGNVTGVCSECGAPVGA